MTKFDAKLSKSEQIEAIDQLLDRHLENFTLGDVQFFERLDNDLDRLCFLIFFEWGVHASAPEKLSCPETMDQREKDFCAFARSIIGDDTPDEFLARPRQLAMGWAKEFLTAEGLAKLDRQFRSELKAQGFGV
jgi:hypothetical protein